MKDFQDNNIKLIRKVLIEELVKALHSNATHIKDSQLRIIAVSFEDNTFNECETLKEYWLKFKDKFASYGYQLPKDLILNGTNYTNIGCEGSDSTADANLNSDPNLTPNLNPILSPNPLNPTNPPNLTNPPNHTEDIQNIDLLSNESLEGLMWNHQDFGLFQVP